jgi:hypothetical protein
MNWERGAGFRVVGFVDKVWSNPAGTVASLTVAVPGRSGREDKLDLKSFDGAIIAQIKNLGAGQTVQVVGGISKEVLKWKREDVLVGGKSAWVILLTIKSIAVQGADAKSDTKAAPKDETPPAQKSWGETHSPEDDWK